MDKHDERAREILDDPQNFILDEIAGYIPVHFGALYGVIATALSQSDSEAAEKATAAERARCAEVVRTGSFTVEYEVVRREGKVKGVAVDTPRLLNAIATAIEKEPG